MSRMEGCWIEGNGTEGYRRECRRRKCSRRASLRTEGFMMKCSKIEGQEGSGRDGHYTEFCWTWKDLGRNRIK